MFVKLDVAIRITKEFVISEINNAAEVYGSRYHYKLVGINGEIGILSFNCNKIITIFREGDNRLEK